MYSSRGITESNISNPANGLKVVAFPNPSKSYFNMQVTSGDDSKKLTLTVTDIMGRIMERRTGVIPNRKTEIGRSLKPGVYFVEVTQGSRKVVQKIIRQ